MHEIKFRAPIKRNDGNYDLVYFDIEDLINRLFSIRELVNPYIKSNGKLDICTNIKDKNGKEIYEGDILAWIIRNDIWVVQYKNDECAFYMFQNRNNHENSMKLSKQFRTLEVIGNIHENPELLENKNE